MKSTRSAAIQQISAVHNAMTRRSGASDRRAARLRCAISRVLDSIGREIGAADSEKATEAFRRWKLSEQKTKLTAVKAEPSSTAGSSRNLDPG